MEEQYREDTLRGSKTVVGMPVYSIQEGQNLGQVKSILIDAREKRLLALVVEKKRLTKEERLLPFEAVKSVGADVLTVERGQALERRNADPAVLRALRRPVQPLGARCFTAGGKTMGKVEEYYFDTVDGSIAQLEISEGGPFKGRMLVPGEYIIALAPHTVMLTDEALVNCRPVENNLLSSMEVARDKAASISRSTVTLLNNSLSKIKGGAKEDGAEEEGELVDATGLAEAEMPKVEQDMMLEPAQEELADAEICAEVGEDTKPVRDAQPMEEAAVRQHVSKSAPLEVEVLMPEEAEQGQPLYAAPPGMMAVEEEQLPAGEEC